MNLNYTLTKKELLSGQLNNVHNSVDWILIDKLTIYIGLPCAILITIPLYLDYSIKTNIIDTIIQIVFCYILYKYIIKRKIWKSILKRKNKNISDIEKLSYSLELNERGVSLSQNENKISFQWSDILKVVDTKEYIHIYITIKEQIFIPKSKAFNSISDLNGFYFLLKANIAKNTFSTYKEARKFSNAFKEYKSRRKNFNI